MPFPDELVALPDPAVAADLVDGPTLRDKLVAQLGPYRPVVLALQAHGLALPVRTLAKTANYTMVPGDGTVLANAAAGAMNVTLPPASAGLTVRVQKVDASANAVTVLPASGTIDGAANSVLALRWLARTFQSDGTNWVTVAKADPPGIFLGTPGVVAGATTSTVVASAKVAGDVSDRLRIRADGALLGGPGGSAPTVEFKPVANGTGWEVNKGNLKIRADTNPAVAPELHFHAIGGLGTDHLAWGAGIDVANLANPAQDFAIFKGYGGVVGDEFYGNARRLLAATWAFGQAPADDRYKLSVVPSIGGGATTVAAGSNGASLPQATINVASTAGFATSGLVLVASSNGPQPIWYTGVTGGSFTGCTGGTGTLTTGGAVGDVNMGGLKIQCSTLTVGKALVITDGAGVDRVWLMPDGTLSGNHDLAGSALCVQADPVNHRTVVMRDSDGTNYFGWYYTAEGLRLRSISSALDFVKFSAADDEVEVYRPLIASGTLTAESALIHTGVTVGFYGVGPAARPPVSTDLLAALATTGLVTTGAATPLDLLGGLLSAGSVRSGTASAKAVLGNWPGDSDYVEMKASSAASATGFALISNGTNTIINGETAVLLRVGGAATTVSVGAANTLGFFGTSPAAKPTGVAVDAAGIHAALVTLGLIAA